MGVIIPLGYVEDRASGALVVDGSLRFDSSKSQYLTRTPSSSGNRKTFTWSYWVKRTNLSTDQMSLGTADASGNNGTYVYMISTDVLRIEDYSTSAVWRLDATQVFRDASAWYHILFAVDTTQTTNSNRVKLYINGVQVTAFSTATYPTLNYDCFMNSNTNPTSIGRTGAYNLIYSGFCISNVYFIDGQALDSSYFGYTDALTNTWRPKKFKQQATPNNGTTWSSAGNFSGNVRSQGDSYGPPKMFNGIIGNESTTGAVCFAPYSSDSTCTWTSPTTFTGLTSLRLYVDLSGTTGKLTVNGVDYSSLVTDLSGGDGWITIPQSSLSTISFGYTGGLNSATGIAAVEVNGVILLDSDTSNIGKNGFYLPFDGSAPIGQDQSGRGNNWTPVNFGGSNTLEKATGALPILNTDGGGKVARVGVRTDSSASSLVLALPLVGVKDDVSNRINSGSTTKTVTATNAVASSAQSNFYGGSFYFDGSGDYLNAGTSTDFVFGTGQFTIEGWIYNQSYNGSNGGTGDSYPTIISTYSGETVNWIVRIYRTGALTWYSPDGGGTNNNSAGGLTQLNTWYHFAYVREGTGSNQFKMYLNGVLVHTLTDSNNYTANETVVIGSQSASNPRNYHTGYLQDLRIYKGLAKYTQNFIPASTDPDILPDTPSGVSYTSNLTQITDGAVAFDGASDYLNLGSSADYNVGTGDFTFECFAYYNTRNDYSGIFGPYTYSTNAILIQISNSSVLRLVNPGGIDVSGTTNLSNRWVHIAVSRSGTTLRGFINGIQEISTTYSSSIDFANGGAAVLGVTDVSTYLGTYDFRGFISNVHFVKGTALYTSNFTPPTAPISSVANTKLLCCKSNSSATAFDVSPGTITANGNAAATNFNPFTVNINTQRGKQSGWATFNPNQTKILGATDAPTLSDGNLTVAGTSSFTGNSVAGTIGVSSGKYYIEYTHLLGADTNDTFGFGIRRDLFTGNYYDWEPYFRGTRTRSTSDNGFYAAASGGSFSAITTIGDVIGIIFDIDNNYCSISVNGIIRVSSSSAGLSGYTWYPYSAGDGGGKAAANFGQKPFKFPPPAGFQPLALANTPRPTIVRPDQYVGVTTYTGNGGTQSIGGLGFKPDLVWIKCRDASVYHALFDSVRGVNKRLGSNETSAEQDQSPSGLSQFLSNGFTVVDGATGGNGINGSPGGLYAGTNASYVAWVWKAGGNSNTYNINDVGYATASAAGLTAGTITPTGASVNTKSGFSIITYNGAGTNSALTSTISHGLTQAPTFMIVKARTGTNAADDWFVYHKSIGPTKRTRLNLTNAADTQTWMGDTEPTSSLITLNQGWYSVNYTGHTHILYAWTEIPGFSKFGTYTGNGSADGPMVITGFRPRWIMIKRTDSADDWNIFDTTRSTYNVMGHDLLANRPDAEYTGTYIDSLSNGFKVRETNSSRNASGGTYIYAAFAETPTQNLYGAQANAR